VPALGYVENDILEHAGADGRGLAMWVSSVQSDRVQVTFVTESLTTFTSTKHF
jgi:hypothetical protein